MSTSFTQVRLHPIGEVSDPHHIRAIGVLWGRISPDWSIILTGGFHGKSLTIRPEAFGLIQKLVKRGVDSALFVVWPRTRNGFVASLEVIGVWKPSILDPDSGAQDDLPEGENWFSIRGEVCHKVWWDQEYGPRVSVKVFGEHFVTVDFDPTQVKLYQGDFVSLDAILTVDGRLRAERVKKISIPEPAVARPHQGSRPGRQVRRRSSAVN